MTPEQAIGALAALLILASCVGLLSGKCDHECGICARDRAAKKEAEARRNHDTFHHADLPVTGCPWCWQRPEER